MRTLKLSDNMIAIDIGADGEAQNPVEMIEPHPNAKLSFSVRQNVWGNWHGYAGNRNVKTFSGSSCFSQEDNAKRWLAAILRFAEQTEINDSI